MPTKARAKPKKPTSKLVKLVTKRIAAIRESKGMTQEAVAEKLKIVPRVYQRIEAGQNVTIATLERIAKVLKVEPGVFFEKA